MAGVSITLRDKAAIEEQVLVSDAEGRVAFEGLFTEGFELLAVASGFEPWTQRHTGVPDRPFDVYIDLCRPERGRVAGGVAAPDGVVLAEALVEGSRGMRARCAVDGSYGTFVLEHQPVEDPFTVRAEAKDSAGRIWRGRVETEVGAATVGSVTILLRPTAGVAGRVTRPDGVSTAGLVVTLRRGWSEPLRPDGTFELTGLEPGRYVLGIGSVAGESLHRTLAVELQPGRTSQLGELVLDPGLVELSVVVLGPDAAPVREAYVDLKLDRSTYSTLTDREGRASFVVPPGEVALLARSYDRASPLAVRRLAPGERAEVRLVVVPRSVIQVRLVDGGGVAIQAFTACLHRLDALGYPTTELSDEEGLIRFGLQRTGRVKLELKDEPLLRQVARRRGVRATRCAPVTLDLPPGETLEVTLRVVDVP